MNPIGLPSVSVTLPYENQLRTQQPAQPVGNINGDWRKEIRLDPPPPPPRLSDELSKKQLELIENVLIESEGRLAKTVYALHGHKLEITLNGLKTVINELPRLAEIVAIAEEYRKDEMEGAAQALIRNPNHKDHATSVFRALLTKCKDRGWTDKPDQDGNAPAILEVVYGADGSEADTQNQPAETASTAIALS